MTQNSLQSHDPKIIQVFQDAFDFYQRSESTNRVNVGYPTESFYESELKTLLHWQSPLILAESRKIEITQNNIFNLLRLAEIDSRHDNQKSFWLLQYASKAGIPINLPEETL
jgi:hypothetical protein